MSERDDQDWRAHYETILAAYVEQTNEMKKLRAALSGRATAEPVSKLQGGHGRQLP